MKEQQEGYKTQSYKEEIQDSAEIYPIQILETEVLSLTIIADATTNKKFLKTHFKVTLWLLLIVLFLKILPSPIIIKSFQNDPNVFTKEICNDDDCENANQGFQSITIKKINPLHRQLKYFVHLNQAKINEYDSILQKSNINLDEQMTWIQIYAVRNNDIYGDVIYQKSGKDVYQVIFNNQPLFFVGEVHILNQVSYMIKIYKLIHKYKAKPTLRMLQGNNPFDNDQNSNQTLNNQNNSTQNNSNNQTKQINQTNQVNQTNQTSQTNQSNQSTQKNETNSQDQTKQVDKQISVPLTVQLVRYSQFYTGIQLLIRYVSLLIILYVAAQTSDCPKIFRIILLFTSNPLIFTEIAFPNTASNIISNMCSSMYVLYVPIFLFYTHRKHPNFKLDIAIKILKLILSLGLYIATVARSMHFMNQSFIENIQYILIAAVLVPIVKYLWRMYFVRSKIVLHRDMLFVILTIYYFSLLFFSGYIVDYGWKKISFYMIVQSYGIALCYLTSPKIRSLKKKKVQSQISALSPNPQIEQHVTNQSNNCNSLQIQPNSAKAQQKYKQQLHTQQLFVIIL